jgi:hypothetical protein
VGNVEIGDLEWHAGGLPGDDRSFCNDGTARVRPSSYSFGTASSVRSCSRRNNDSRARHIGP